MRKWSQVLMAVLFAAAVAACESRPAENTGTDAGAGAGADAATGTSGRESVGMMEREFIEDQLQDGQAEITLGGLASERGTSADVKEFGQMMVRDHTKARQDLNELIRAENVQIDTPDEGEHQDLHERLSKLSGGEFDREYIDAMIEDHEETVNELERHTDSDNARLKQFASSTLPVIRQHLEKARQIKEQLDNQQTP